MVRIRFEGAMIFEGLIEAPPHVERWLSVPSTTSVTDLKGTHTITWERA